MQIHIQALSFPLTEELRRHTERRLAFALSTREEHIQRVTVRLSDINGPRGGRDMCCQIQVKLNGLAEVVVKDTEAEIATAIDRAADRVGRTVSRQLTRKLDRKRSLEPAHRKTSNLFGESIGDLSA